MPGAHCAPLQNRLQYICQQQFVTARTMCTLTVYETAVPDDYLRFRLSLKFDKITLNMSNVPEEKRLRIQSM
jgi:hypothetical protein